MFLPIPPYYSLELALTSTVSLVLHYLQLMRTFSSLLSLMLGSEEEHPKLRHLHSEHITPLLPDPAFDASPARLFDGVTTMRGLEDIVE